MTTEERIIFNAERARQMREWARRNPEKVKAISKKTREKNRDKISERIKSKYANDPDFRARTLERAKLHQQKNSEARKVYMRAYYAANADKFRKKTKDWDEANPERARVNAIHYNHRRRERISRTPAKEAVLCKQIIARESGKAIHVCYYCKRKFRGVFHIDHVTALSLGGKHDVGNIAISCPECNLSKSDKELARVSATGQSILNL